jgi:hypothetical protein
MIVCLAVWCADLASPTVGKPQCSGAIIAQECIPLVASVWLIKASVTAKDETKACTRKYFSDA